MTAFVVIGEIVSRNPAFPVPVLPSKIVASPIDTDGTGGGRLVRRQQHGVVVALCVECRRGNLATVVDGIGVGDMQPRAGGNQRIQVRHDTIDVDPAMKVRDTAAGRMLPMTTS